MSGWADVRSEVARWRDMGRAIELWWRDDDAVDATAALDRLLAIRESVALPLALAVVPSRARAALADRLAGDAAVAVLQHGYAHVNHGVAGAKKIELGAERPAMMVLGELGTGWLALERLFAERALPILVPPWNRIAPGLVPVLPEIGFAGLSTFGARRTARVGRLAQANTHVDLIDWRGSRGFVGEAVALDGLVNALAAARRGPGEPIGMLSHHLAMDEGAWDFLRSFWETALCIPGIRTCSAGDLFALREARA